MNIPKVHYRISINRSIGKYQTIAIFKWLVEFAELEHPTAGMYNYKDIKDIFFIIVWYSDELIEIGENAYISIINGKHLLFSKSYYAYFMKKTAYNFYKEKNKTI